MKFKSSWAVINDADARVQNLEASDGQRTGFQSLVADPPRYFDGVAGIVTAFAVLIVALYQAGFLDRQSAKNSPGQASGPVSANCVPLKVPFKYRNGMLVRDMA